MLQERAIVLRYTYIACLVQYLVELPKREAVQLYRLSQ